MINPFDEPFKNRGEGNLEVRASNIVWPKAKNLK